MVGMVGMVGMDFGVYFGGHSRCFDHFFGVGDVGVSIIIGSACLSQMIGIRLRTWFSFGMS